MKKRIMCALLTLIMLVSLVPVTASAAGLSISEGAITVLKQLEDYKNYCTQNGTEYRNGYGTICTQTGDHSTHTITEKNADKALRAKLKELDAAVSSFGTGIGKAFSQSQHDALVIFSYDCGTSWMNGTGVLRSAIVNGAEDNDFINIMCGFKSNDDDDRRRVEAAMYLNGRYSDKMPGTYVWVKFDANGGNMAENPMVYYDSAEPVTISRVPTLKNHTFMGWYTAADTGYRVTTLNDSSKRMTLYARWQDNNNPQPIVVSYTASINQFTSLQPLADHRDDAPALGDMIWPGTVVEIVREFLDKDGARWCRIKDTGWVKVGAYQGGDLGAEIDVIVTVTNSYVRSRKNATVFSAQNGSYSKGDKLRIINTASKDGFLWGQVANDSYQAIGWVALMYTDWNNVKDAGTANTNPTNAIATAVINCDGYLNVRNEAGTDNAIVGSLADGDTVEIYEIKFVNGHKWGRTTTGWILLTYAKVTMLNTNVDYTTSEDVLAYTFTGTLNVTTTPRKDATFNSDAAGDTLQAGSRVAISMVKEVDGKIWGFTGIGWLKLEDITMDVAKYVVVSDSVNVRQSADSGSAAVEKVVKGVELDITEIAVVDATIWGYSAKYGGWVNLASKYVSRSNAPTIDKAQPDEDSVSGLVATVINTDKVRVRKTSGTFGVKVIGSLTRGTTVAVWEANDDGDWYKVDSNKNGTYDYYDDGWVSASYLEISKASISTGNGAGTGSSASGNDTSSSTGSTVVETGLGIVSNTYTGVNVRTGAGTGNATVGKILTGTTVEITEVKQVGASKWGRVNQGWICMDYVTMISNYPVGDSNVGNDNSNSSAGANAGGATSTTEGDTTVESTPAVYTGRTNYSVQVLKTADEDALPVRTLAAGANVTIQELRKVTTTVTISAGSVVDGNTTTETKTYENVITYWARINDGWIADPENSLSLNSLDEITYTVTGANTINVRETAGGAKITTLDKGTQVVITSLVIDKAKVWGLIEDIGTNGGWVQLDNLSEGAISTKEETPVQPQQPQQPGNSLILGSTGNTANQGTNGFVNNTSGYRYTGKVIRTNSVNVRALPSQTATLTTTLKSGAALVIYETTVSEGMAWGRCDAGWVYLYYVDLQPCNTAVDAKVVYQENTIAYTDANCSGVAGTYSRMSVVDIYEVVGSMARTDLGWVSVDNLG